MDFSNSATNTALWLKTKLYETSIHYGTNQLSRQLLAFAGKRVFCGFKKCSSIMQLFIK